MMMEHTGYRVLKQIFLACVLVAMLLIFYSGGYWLTASVLLFGLAAAAAVRIPEKRFAIALCIVTFAVRLLLIVLLPTQPASDFALQYQAAQQFASHDFSYLENPYFQTWGYQVGLVIYEGLLLRLWNNIIIIKMVNALFATGTVYLIYRIARHLTADIPARIAAVCYSVLLFPALYVTVLNNSLQSGFFTLAAIALWLRAEERQNKTIQYIGIGLCCTAAAFFRPGTIVLLLAMAATALFGCIRRANRRTTARALYQLAIVFVVYFVSFRMISYATEALGYTQDGLTNGNPLWQFVVGTDTAHNGGWSAEASEHINTLMQEQGISRDEAELQITREQLSVPKRHLMELATFKIKTFWTETTLGWSLKGCDVSETAKNRLTEVAKTQQYLLLLATLLGAVAFFAKRQKDSAWILPFFLMATFCAYVVIEVQPRYSYTVQLVMAVLSASCIAWIWRGVCSVRQRIAAPDETKLS